MLTNKKILLGITGGIAAYKSAELVRLLKKAGAEVKVVMTAAATQFIAPLTLQALSGEPVYTDLFSGETDNAMSHISLARWANIFLVAPATADCLAKFAYGHADNLLTTLYLANNAPVYIVPAMNQQMWQHPTTQENIKRLQQQGVHCIGPASGLQACGENGLGRMEAPLQILSVLAQAFIKPVFSGEKILITAGPTREPIDPVRYISNHSSGKMGFALAQAAQSAGAEVILIAGPVSLPTPNGVTRIDVDTAQNMHETVMQYANNVAVVIATAAVADFRAVIIKTQKIKKTDNDFSLQFTLNPDILASLHTLKSKPYLVAFAAETENLLENARQKFQRKKPDLLVANNVIENPFGSEENTVWILDGQGEIAFEKMTKTDLAEKLILFIAERYHANSSN